MVVPPILEQLPTTPSPLNPSNEGWPKGLGTASGPL